jgi:hypothetical protein
MDMEQWIKSSDIQFENLPAEFKDRTQWVAWIPVPRGGKITKPPVDPKTGLYAEVNNPSTWGSYEEARRACAYYAGIGYVFTELDGVTMVDLDNCRDPVTRAIDDWARQIVNRMLSYTSISPSRTGLRVLVAARLLGDLHVAENLPWPHRKGAKIEFYDKGRYTTLTGHLLNPWLNTIRERQGKLTALYEEVFQHRAENRMNGEYASPANDLLIERIRQSPDGEEFERLLQGIPQQDETLKQGDLKLCRIIARHGRDAAIIDQIIRASKRMRNKWDERQGAETYGWHTIQKALRLESKGQILRPKLSLVRVSELAKQTEPVTEYILEDVLPVGGSSLLIGKPKAGKSTFGTNLAIAVARGESFLELNTKKMPVLYIALAGEAKQSELLNFFRARRAENEDIYIYADIGMSDLVAQLRQHIRQYSPPPLVIIDTLGKAVSVKDFNAYGEVLEKLTPYVQLARETDAHIMMLHHANKGMALDLGDGALGSTAITAAVDTVLYLSKKGEFRKIESEQRYGTAIPETILAYDPHTYTLTKMGGARELEHQEIARKITVTLRRNPNGLTFEQIHEGIEARTETVRAVLYSMNLIRTGSGRRGDPYVFCLNASGNGSPTGVG